MTRLQWCLKNKTMKIQLTKKYLSFIITAISFIFLISCQKEASPTTSSKIIYTDIIPDTIVTSWASYNLDLDKDGVYDFRFDYTVTSTQCRATGGYGTEMYIEVEPADNSSNKILNVVYVWALPNFLDTIPAALDTLKEISSKSGALLSSYSQTSTGSVWLSSSSQILRYSNTCCCSAGEYFFDSNDKYLGLKLVKGSQVFYGWARLNGKMGYLDGTPLLLKDYAYNSGPNEPILSGQKE